MTLKKKKNQKKMIKEETLLVSTFTELDELK